MAYGSLLADVVQSSTAGTPPQFNDGNGTQTGTLCRAWVNFNGLSGASPVIRSSFNVSSVTRNGTGNYTVALTNAMSDANYCVTIGAFISTTTSNTGRSAGAYSYSTGSFIIQSGYVGVQDDMQFMNAAVFK